MRKQNVKVVSRTFRPFLGWWLELKLAKYGYIYIYQIVWFLNYGNLTYIP